MLFRRGSARTEAFEHRVLFKDWNRELERDELAEVSSEPAVSTLISFLNCFGRFSFDTEQVRSDEVKEQAAGWIGHLLNGDAPPSRRATTGGAKDWRGAAEFFRDQRRIEQRYVTRSVAGLRDVIWDFIQRVGSTVTTERGSNLEIQQRLQKLKDSVSTSSLELLREEVIRTAHYIGSTLEEREKRQANQLQLLGGRLREMRSELAEVRKEMATDSLTRVFNRHALDQQMARVGQFSRFSGQTPALFIMDVDRFKDFNDRYGHRTGDAVLRKIADCCVRSFPRGTDFIARYGGDEFVVLVEDCNPSLASSLVQRLLDWVRNSSVEFDGEQVAITVSVGAALLSPDETVEDWFNRADQALREVKSRGRDGSLLHETMTPATTP